MALHRSRFETIMHECGIDEDWSDGCDDWGSTMGLFFDVAAVLNMSDIEGDVTPEAFARWDFNPSPYVSVPDLESVAALSETYNEKEYSDDYSFNVIALAESLVNGSITQEDLIYVGNVLDKYTAILRIAGKDY